mmetsp:Transcript_40244/g.107861  ORF Transcript_40244/g.107861 Transcript_40244/m.107861 type:complete len:243 (+) Transcript_40244:1246-1974(+)
MPLRPSWTMRGVLSMVTGLFYRRTCRQRASRRCKASGLTTIKWPSASLRRMRRLRVMSSCYHLTLVIVWESVMRRAIDTAALTNRLLGRTSPRLVWSWSWSCWSCGTTTTTSTTKIHTGLVPTRATPKLLRTAAVVVVVAASRRLCGLSARRGVLDSNRFWQTDATMVRPAKRLARPTATRWCSRLTEGVRANRSRGRALRILWARHRAGTTTTSPTTTMITATARPSYSTSRRPRSTRARA